LIFGAVLVVRQIAYRSVNCYKICSVLIVCSMVLWVDP
jgi:hypothetical protein